MKKNNILNLFKNLYLPIIVGSFIFFWDVQKSLPIFFENKIFDINLRYVILILICPAFLKILKEIKKGQFNFIKHFFIIFLILFIHLYANILYEEKELSNSLLGSILFTLALYTISYFYYNEIMENISQILFIFLIIFLVTTVYSVFNFHNDTPYFCGGIPNFLNNSLGLDLNPDRNISDLRFSFRHLLFFENSHLGFIAPGVILYSITQIYNKNYNKLKISLFCFFLVICFIKSSTTFFVGTIVSLITILIFNFKNISKRLMIIFILFLSVLLTIVFSNNECKNRFVPSYNSENILGSKTTVLLKETLQVTGGQSISAGVFFRSFLITIHSIKSKPFGRGINRYEEAFNEYNKTYPPKSDLLNYLNNRDAVNNFNKLIVEFGVFSFFIFFLIFKFLIDKRINLENKLFLLPIVITQMIRGAGYFNGGFILIIILMFLAFIREKK